MARERMCRAYSAAYMVFNGIDSCVRTRASAQILMPVIRASVD